MPFEKQIHRLLYVISQKQTNKKTNTWKKTQHRRNLWAACQSVEDQRAHVFLVKSESHRFELFRLSCSLLVWFPVRVVDFGLHAIHALRPLSIEHSPLLLTKSPGEDNRFSWDFFYISFLKGGVTKSVATDGLLPLVLDVTFHLVQLFSKHTTRFEVQHTLIASADEEQVKTNTKIQCCKPFEIHRNKFKTK